MKAPSKRSYYKSFDLCKRDAHQLSECATESRHSVVRNHLIIKKHCPSCGPGPNLTGRLRKHGHI